MDFPKLHSCPVFSIYHLLIQFLSCIFKPGPVTFLILVVRSSVPFLRIIGISLNMQAAANAIITILRERNLLQQYHSHSN